MLFIGQPGNNRILSPMIEFPALSVPAGFTPDGLPVGLQLVGRSRGEAELLRLARAFTEATGLTSRRPEL